MARQGFHRIVDARVLVKREKKICPWCGEDIHLDSLICYICGRLTHSPARKDPGIAATTNTLALAILILSCLSFLIVPGVMAIAFGHVALAKIRKDPIRLKGGPLARAGLLLAYIGTGLGLFFLVFYGYPSFLRYRETVRENAAIQSLQILNVALQTYAETYGKGFPESLSQLGPPPADARIDSQAAGLVRPSLASGRDSEYTFTYTIISRNGQGHPAAYTINANPPKSSCSRECQLFFTDQNQLIREAQFHAASIESPLIIADSAEPVELH
jgi:uncharacterized protein DUF4190